jgi:TonB family protein
MVLALAAAMARAQQELPPPAVEGPMRIKPAAPVPDANGVYAAGPGILAPIVLERIPVVYPEDAAADAVNGICVVSVVIGADGVPANIQVVTSHGAAFDAAVIEAVRQSQYQAGTLDGKPVPVRIFARVRFFDDKRPTYPRILVRLGPEGGLRPFGGEFGSASRPFDKPPMATYSPAASYTEKARRAKLSGVVMLSTLVTEEGLPTDIRVEKPLGMGLDESAVECVSRYRFSPAMKEGVPVPARIHIQVSFRVY